MTAVLADNSEEMPDLNSSLCSAAAQVGYYNSHRSAVHAQIDIYRPPWLETGHTQINEPKIHHGASSEESIAVAAVIIPYAGAGNGFVPGHGGDIVELGHSRYSRQARIDFLQAYQVRPELMDDSGNPLGTITAVNTNTPVDIVGRHRKAGLPYFLNCGNNSCHCFIPIEACL